MTCQALLIDISGKQKYIFGSNKLKLNIGASHIVAHEVFGECLMQSIKKVFKIENTQALQNEWQQQPNDIFVAHSAISIGYVGGGNALLLFAEGVDVEAFVQHYSEQLLHNYHGIQPVFAVHTDFNTDTLAESRDTLNAIISRNKSLYHAISSPFKHGIEADCPLTGNAQEVYNKTVEAWVSREAHHKISSARKSNKKLLEDYENELKDNFTFSDELEDISPETEKRYIAVVHIDGNGMGKLFKEISTLDSLRRKSVQVSKKLELSMQRLIKYLVKEIKFVEGKAVFANEITLKKEGKKWILPFRPIINAGDDITFVCHGKLGVHLAEKYIDILNDSTIGEISIPSCAGISIFHTKYPFSRIYDLTEQLATNAKKQVRGTEPPQSSLNFLVSSEGYMGDLDKLSTEIIDYQGNSLINQVYIIGEQYDDLKKQLRELRSKWSKTKAIKLREMFFADEVERREFAMQVKYRKIDNGYIYTKYSYNAIELFNFYPVSLL